VDSRGSFCPGPITDLFKAYRAANVGDEIEVWATDPAAKPDIEAWASRSGNAVLETGQDGDHLKIVVRILRKGR
jgi:TusA-related sulfurtransferase